MRVIKVCLDNLLKPLEFEGDDWVLEFESGRVRVDSEEQRKMWCWPKERVIQVSVVE